MARDAGPDALSASVGRDGGARGGDRGWTCGRTDLAPRTSAALHCRDQRRSGRAARSALSGSSRRTRRAVYLSRTGPAGRLCDAEPQRPQSRRALLRPCTGGLGNRRAGPAGDRSVPRAGPDRYLDPRSRAGGEDRRDRGQSAALGHAAWLRGQPQPRSGAFRRDRAMRHRRTSGDERGDAGKIDRLRNLWGPWR